MSLVPVEVQLNPGIYSFELSWEHPSGHLEADILGYGVYRKKSTDDNWISERIVEYNSNSLIHSVAFTLPALVDYDIKVETIIDGAEPEAVIFENVRVLFPDNHLQPVKLSSYWSNIFGRNLRVFYWYLSPVFADADLSNFDFELQLDTSIDFDSENLKTVRRQDIASEEQIHDGKFIKGVTIDIGDYLEEETQYYWRVRIGYPFEATSNYASVYESDFSEVSSFTLEQDLVIPIAEALLNSLPDVNVYNKDILHLPVEERDTVLWQLLVMYAEEFARSLIEANRVGSDNYLEDVRELSIFNNFGTFFGISKTESYTWPEYRELIKVFVNASLYGGTLKAVKDSVEVIIGARPDISTLKEKPGWLLDFDILVKDTDDLGDPDHVSNVPSPTLLLNTEDYGFGVIITIQNPFQLERTEELVDLIRETVFRFIPAHVKVYFRFVNDLNMLLNEG